jgi:hypothetical protein
MVDSWAARVFNMGANDVPAVFMGVERSMDAGKDGISVDLCRE